jgi:hypothetical protein
VTQDPVHFVRRQAQHPGDPVTREIRLLRAGPQSRSVGAGTPRRHRSDPCWRATGTATHIRLDEPRGTRKDRVDFSNRNGHFALDDGRLTNAVVECGIFGKGGGISD